MTGLNRCTKEGSMKKLMIAAVAGLALASASGRALADGDDAGIFALGVVIGSVLAPQPVYRYYAPPATVTVVPGGYYTYRYRPYFSYRYRPYFYGYSRWRAREWREHAWRRHVWRRRAWRRHERREHEWRRRERREHRRWH
ncbi:hypothetical protein BMS3Bbin13_01633 [bacterium BMS3Bbin13]|nr:hypothetical protein BMS3Bbin13_01633 [bacterium BMS3Bbin13]